MAYETAMESREPAHNLTMEGRRRLTVSGITDVESFHEEEVVMTASSWTMAVRGEGLHMEKLSVDTGDVILTGRIDAITYEEAPPVREGLLARIFR